MLVSASRQWTLKGRMAFREVRFLGSTRRQNAPPLDDDAIQDFQELRWCQFKESSPKENLKEIEFEIVYVPWTWIWIDDRTWIVS